MKFQINKKDLIKSLEQVKKVIGRDREMPILQNCLIDVGHTGLLSIRATDLGTWVIAGAYYDLRAAENGENGKVTVNCKALLDAVKKIPGNAVTNAVILETLDNDTLSVTSGNGGPKLILPTISADDFPIAPQMPPDAIQYNFTHQELLTGFGKVLHAACIRTDAYGRLPAGVYLHSPSADSAMRFVATDGHRLSVYCSDRAGVTWGERWTDTVPARLEPRPGIIVARSAITALLGILKAYPGPATMVGLSISGDWLGFSTDRWAVYGRLPDEKFPTCEGYERVIPDNRYTVELDRANLLDALKQLKIVTDAVYRYVSFNLSTRKLELSAGNPELGSASAELACDWWGDDVSTVFNIGYVIDALSVMTGGLCRFEFDDEPHAHGAVFTDCSDTAYLSMIMPMVL